MKLLRLLVLLAFASPALAQHYRQPSQMSLDGTFTFVTLPTASSYPGYTAYTSDQGPVYSNGSAWASMAGGGVPPTITANTVLGNGTASAAAPQQLAMPGCSTSGSALKWTTSTGFGCNSSIDAATLGGATFAAPGSIGSGTAAPGAFTTLSATGAITSTLATGTAPFTVASTTNVANLNASLLGGATFAAPGAIGGGTPAAGSFTTLSANSTVTGAGFFPAFTGDVTKGSNSQATTVTALNGTSLGGLATGLIKNTTTTGVPVIVPGFPVMFGIGSQAQATTTYYAPGAIGASVAVGALAPMGGTFKNMYIRVATAPAGVQTDTYTLYVGTAGSAGATSVTCTITGVATTCNDTTHTAAITVGQAWAVQVVTSSTAAGTGQQMVGVEIDP